MASEYLYGMQYGQGCTFDLKKIHGFAIDNPTLRSSVKEADGATSQFSLTVIKSSEEIAKSLNVSGKLDYSGVFEASASAKFLENTNYSRYRTYVMVRHVITAPVQSLQDPVLKASVSEKIPEMTDVEFYKAFGTEFLSGIVSGGYYFGILEIESTSEEKQREIDAQITSGGWGVTAEGSVSNRLNSATKNLAKKVQVIREGGPVNMEPAIDVDEMIQQAREFGSSVEENPKLISAIYQRYDESFLLKFKSSDSFDLASRRHDLQHLGKRYMKLVQLRNDIEFVMAHYHDYQKGSGVVFELYGQVCNDKSLAMVSLPEISANVSVETDLDSAEELMAMEDVGAVAAMDMAGPTATLDMKQLEIEYNNVSNKILEIVDAAKRCRDGANYTVPAPYVAPFELPRIKEDNVIVKDMIIMWSGSMDMIPDGWALCDGKNGTPDLRDRFVMGASGGSREDLDKGYVKVGEHGDEDRHTHDVQIPEKDFTSNRVGDHSHGMPGGWYDTMLGGNKNSNAIDRGGESVKRQQTQSGGGHDHKIKVAFDTITSTRTEDRNRPKWYALAYLMRV